MDCPTTCPSDAGASRARLRAQHQLFDWRLGAVLTTGPGTCARRGNPQPCRGGRAGSRCSEGARCGGGAAIADESHDLDHEVVAGGDSPRRGRRRVRLENSATGLSHDRAARCGGRWKRACSASFAPSTAISTTRSTRARWTCAARWCGRTTPWSRRRSSSGTRSGEASP